MVGALMHSPEVAERFTWKGSMYGAGVGSFGHAAVIGLVHASLQHLLPVPAVAPGVPGGQVWFSMLHAIPWHACAAGVGGHVIPTLVSLIHAVSQHLTPYGPSEPGVPG